MSQDPSQPVPGGTMEPPRASTVSRLLRSFFSPAAVFGEVKAAPGWVVPLVALILLGLVVQLFVVPRIDMERTIREAMAQRTSTQQIPDDQMDRILAQADKWKWLGPIAAVILGPIVLVLIGGIYHLGLRAFGAETDFKQAFATYLYASWPASLVLTLLTSVVAVQKGSFSGEEAKGLVKAGLDALLPASASPVLHSVAGVFSVFNVWQWVLLVMGFQTVAGVKRRHAVTLVVAVWGVWLLLKVGGALLKTAF